MGVDFETRAAAGDCSLTISLESPRAITHGRASGSGAAVIRKNIGALSFSLSLSLSLSETGIGGVKTYRTLEGGELAPKVAPRRLGLLTPKLAIFYRISVERGQFQGPLEIHLTPPIPVSNSLSLCLVAPTTSGAALPKAFLRERGNRALVPSTAKLRIWTLRIWGFRGPGFRSARTLQVHRRVPRLSAASKGLQDR